MRVIEPDQQSCSICLHKPVCAHVRELLHGRSRTAFLEGILYQIGEPALDDNAEIERRKVLLEGVYMLMGDYCASWHWKGAK